MKKSHPLNLNTFEIQLLFSFLMEAEEGFGVLLANGSSSTGMIGRLQRGVSFCLKYIDFFFQM